MAARIGRKHGGIRPLECLQAKILMVAFARSGMVCPSVKSDAGGRVASVAGKPRPSPPSACHFWALIVPKIDTRGNSRKSIYHAGYPLRQLKVIASGDVRRLGGGPVRARPPARWGT